MDKRSLWQRKALNGSQLRLLIWGVLAAFLVVVFITPARKFRMLLHINPTPAGKRTGSLAGTSGWYMAFFAAGVIPMATLASRNNARRLCA